jgi:hypothetical protein
MTDNDTDDGLMVDESSSCATSTALDRALDGETANRDELQDSSDGHRGGHR